MLRIRSALALVLAAAPLLGACADEPDVVIYCALDQTFSEPLLARFEAETGLRVRAEFDVEAHKTVGLVRRIQEERGRPRCDVFWNNEIAHTVKLAEEGLLAAYDSPSAAAVPEAFRDPGRRWTGIAARARVFIVNTELCDPAEVRGLRDLLDPKWQGRCAMARPLTGTTLTHFTALGQLWGPEAVLQFLRDAEAAGVHFTGGNGQVMRLVASGQLAWGLTDTDDFNVAREDGHPVVQVFPDQDGEGTLLIPNTVAVLAEAPHPEAARRLVDFILSEAVEAELAASRSAQIPVRTAVPRPEHVRAAGEVRVQAVDWARVGAEIDERFQVFSELFVR